MKTLTHNEGKPLRKPILVYWDQCDPNCPGWGHFDSNYGPDIERCDDCSRFDDDDEAQAAHAEECGCDWGIRPENCPDCAAPNNNGEPGRCRECEA